MQNLLPTLSIELQAKLKDFNVSNIFVEMGEVNVKSEYDLDPSFIAAIEKEVEANAASVTFKVMELKTGFFAVVKFENEIQVAQRRMNWTKEMANYELGFYLDGTLKMESN